MFGFLETIIEYYLPGLDASQMNDDALAMKLAHLRKIREMESEDYKKKM